MLTENLTKAREILTENRYTLALFDGNELITSEKRGVAPLLSLQECRGKLRGFSAADRVVGKGAALLYALLEIKELYTPVISLSARDVLSENGISVIYDKCVPYIINRKGDGMCPIERAVQNTSNPYIALSVIRSALENLGAK